MSASRWLLAVGTSDQLPAYTQLCENPLRKRLIADPTRVKRTMRSAFIVGIVGLIAVACKGDQTRSKPSRALTGSADRAAESPPVALEGKAQGVATGVTQSANAASAPQSAPDRVTAAGTAQQIAPSMLIRTGSASIEVPKLDPAILKVRQLATQLGGYIANSSISGGRDQVRSATLEMKIPAAQYDQVIGGLGGIGKVESVNTSVEDVGEEYVDVSARVANAKRLEERFIGLLATRTGRLQDVLAVERELARVREEIERYEGRLRFLRTRAAVSTLSVTVHEPMPILGQNPGDNPIIGALKQAWRNFVGFIAWFIASLGVLIPFGALSIAGWYVFRRFRKRNKDL